MHGHTNVKPVFVIPSAYLISEVFNIFYLSDSGLNFVTQIGFTCLCVQYNTYIKNAISTYHFVKRAS